MSRQSTDFNEWLESLAGIASAHRWRYLVLLSGSREWSLALCEASPMLCSSDNSSDTLWVSDPPPEGQWSIAPASARSLLGSETGHIVYDAWSGFHPNGFGALAGTLRAGGLLVLLAPPLSRWGQYRDPDCRRLAVAGFECRPRSYFLEHLAHTLRQDSQVMLFSEDAGLPELPAMPASATPVEPRVAGNCRTRDQADAVAAIEHVLGGHRDRPLVLTADRGRGKSAALGIAAARLLADRVDFILVTAPLWRSVATLFKHARTLLAGAEQQEQALVWRGRRIQYLPPDELLRTTPSARLLLVDEAAAIPAPLLSRMLDHYHRVVFTTTVHGYEGTGRGFAVRFQRELDRRRPHWQHQRLVEPVRWAEHDPLEQTVGRLLWLDAEAAPDEQLQDIDLDGATTDGTITIEMIERRALLEQPPLMSQLVGLLTTAHYRTTPDDIRLLLDAPNMALLLARRGEILAGVILIAREGGLDAALIAAIRQGRRRPRGHLLPQILWAQTGCEQLLGRRGWRVVRIAVHPAIQRRGLGLQLLENLRRLAIEQGLAYLGSSFGATAELVAFWRKAAYTPLAIGVRRDAASGAHGLLVLQGLDEVNIGLVEQQRQRFAEVLPLMLAEALQGVEPDIVAALLRGLSPHTVLQPRDRQDVQDFVSGARSYEHCTLGLQKAALLLLADKQRSRRLDTRQRDVLIARVLQRQSWAELARRSGLSGKAQLLECLRHALVF